MKIFDFIAPYKQPLDTNLRLCDQPTKVVNIVNKDNQQKRFS